MYVYNLVTLMSCDIKMVKFEPSLGNLQFSENLLYTRMHAHTHTNWDLEWGRI